MLKKAILPAGGLGTRFLPLTKAITKDVLPLVDRPMISYAVEEAARAGISQITFVVNEKRDLALGYFKKHPKLEATLKKRGSKDLLKDLNDFERYFDNVSFSTAIQPSPKGDGDAILKAKKQVGKSPFAVLFFDDLFDAKKPAICQLRDVFKTAQKPVLGLRRVPLDKVSSYGNVAVEKIAHRLYKIKAIIEKPDQDEIASDLVFCGRYVFTPEVFGYLEKTMPNKKGEVILAEAVQNMLADGKIIYGYEIEGEWLECGKMKDWLKSNLYLLSQHPEYGQVVRDFFKKGKK